LRKRVKALISVLFLFVAFESVNAQDALPIHHPSGISELRELECDTLQILLKEEIFKNKQWKQLVENKKMAIGIVDLSDLDNVKYAGLNSDYMMYAASLPKIAVLLTVMDAISKGELQESPELTNEMRMMISKSSNSAATRLIDTVGFERIEQTLRDLDYRFYDEESGGGLWVGKRYASSGRRYPDPLKGLSHGATVSMVCSFYYKLAFGKLINEKRSAEMLDILKDPALTHKFVNTLKRIAPNTAIYRKSGTWKTYHADSVLVWGPERRYIIVALIENSNGGNIMKNLVEPVEDVFKNLSASTCK
jgi:beta-lactamase class A